MVMIQEMVVLLASLRICEMYMVAKEIFLVVRILFEALVVLDTFKHHLTETVKVCDIDHLGVDNFAHESPCRALVVDLHRRWS